MVWEPGQYLRGSYFQMEVNETFRNRLNIKPFGNVLDVGCGDGQYTHFLADNIPQGQILGIDNSPDMIQHANQYWSRKNLSFAVHNIEEFQSSIAFDFVLSFWCLHWTNIGISFSNICHALKPGGKLYAVFSSFSENSILETWRELAKQNRYKDLTHKYIHPRSQNNTYIFRVISILNQLPFKRVKLTIETIYIYFPTLDYFRNLLLTMPFMKSFPAECIEALIEDMLDEFQNICMRKHGGALYYQTRPIFIEAIK